jgi:hypothetical protein
MHTLTAKQIETLKTARDNGPIPYASNGQTNRMHNMLIVAGYLETVNHKVRRITLEGLKALEAAK